ncbi:SdiA-regulated domain-containing protein [Bdellovibrio bacteriovorus]|uniref:Uncharacterized protein n=1 Tax=Bdellovibrio bacteriovorus TaxID=959 RepID=A0A1Z3NBB4_BDEBC|nr:SdiA-regulated domain-containing protein [Bdellovibrio bacteriovorus]ASD64711.1 hypothetical protein B9G79_14625 [Bdellovibrio bacteriovorus]
MKTQIVLATLLSLSTSAFAAETVSVQKALPEVGSNLSGITYNYDSDSYFLIQNNSGNIFEYKADFTKPVRTIRMTNLTDADTEDIVYLGNNQYAISTESNQVLILKIDEVQTTVDVRDSRDDVQMMQLPAPAKHNKGLEGVCFSKKHNTFYAVQEKKPKRIFEWTRPSHGNDIADAAALGVKEPFDTEKILKHVMSDLSACIYDDKNDQLLLLSHESSRVMRLNRQGQVVSTTDLPLLPDQYEGMTFSKDGKLIVVSEPNIVVILK